jgi:hypothetical protein
MIVTPVRLFPTLIMSLAVAGFGGFIVYQGWLLQMLSVGAIGAVTLAGALWIAFATLRHMVRLARTYLS